MLLESKKNAPKVRYIAALRPVGGGVTLSRSRLGAYIPVCIYSNCHSELDSKSIIRHSQTEGLGIHSCHSERSEESLKSFSPVNAGIRKTPFLLLTGEGDRRSDEVLNQIPQEEAYYD